MGDSQERPYVPARHLDTPFPLIDSDPHIKRVIGYARPSDWAGGAAVTLVAPGIMRYWEWKYPSLTGKGALPPIMRLSWALSATAGFLWVCTRSAMRFYGFNENEREREMDMREMVDKVKRGEPLYGVSSLSPYQQGMASRNSRYAGLFYYMIPWFNFVNHEQHGVDTAKYYQQAERELEAAKS